MCGVSCVGVISRAACRGVLDRLARLAAQRVGELLEAHLNCSTQCSRRDGVKRGHVGQNWECGARWGCAAPARRSAAGSSCAERRQLLHRRRASGEDDRAVESDAAPKDTSQITSLVNLSVTEGGSASPPPRRRRRSAHTMAPPTKGSVASGPSPPKSGAPTGLPPISDLTLPRAFETPPASAATRRRRLPRRPLGAERGDDRLQLRRRRVPWSELAYEIGRSIRWTAGCVRQVCSSDGRSSVRSRRWPTAPYL